MKITGLELDAVHVNHRGDWIFVHILTDEGLKGVGEMRAAKGYGDRLRDVRTLVDHLKGRNPFEIDQIVSEYGDPNANRNQVAALSAVEPALWDLKGKALGVPVHELMGGRCRDEIRLYANINRATTDRSPEGFAKNAAAAVADGFDAVKLAPFDGMSRGVDSAQEAAKGIACMQAVREAIRPDTDLLIDCHNHFSVKGALEVADALRELNLFWYEQPTPEANIENAVAVKQQCELTVAGGEQRAFRQGWIDVFENKSMDVIMPDVTVIGGLGELKKVSEMADAWGIPTAPHGPFGPIAIACHVEAMAAHPGFLILEFAWGETDWRHTLISPQEEVVNGRIQVNDRPGLGFELNPEGIDAHRVMLD